MIGVPVRAGGFRPQSDSLLLILLVLFGSMIPLQALKRDTLLHFYSLSQWQVKEGLANNSITSLLQTEDGYLWIGTYEGLIRFDGLNFHTFNPIDLMHSTSKMIIGLIPRRRGGFYALTQASIVVWENNRFSLLYDTRKYFSSRSQTILEDHQGHIWVGTKNEGLFRFSPQQTNVYTIGEGLAHNNVRALFEDRNHVVWIGTENGLNRIDQGKWMTYLQKDGLNQNYILSFYEDSSGLVWIGTREGGLHLWQNGRFLHLPLPGDKENQNSVTCITGEANGNLWLATLKGLYRFHNGRFESLTMEDGLPFDLMRTLFIDREGNLWLGTNGGGLVRLKDGKFIRYSTRNGLRVNFLMGMYGDQEGTLWLATNGGGLNWLKEGRIQAFTKEDGLMEDSIWTVYGDRRGRIWTGSYANGLGCYDHGKFYKYTSEHGLDTKEIRSLYVDSRDRLWIGTRIGLYRMEEGRIRRVSGKNAPDGQDIRALIEDRKGSLWIGTFGAGLYRYRQGAFTSFQPEQGLSNVNLLSFYCDEKNALWIGTNGGGLNRVIDDQIFHYTLKDGLPADNIFQILEDNFENLWFSHSRGIFRISRKQLEEYARGTIRTLTPVVYGETDGISGNGCQGGFQPAGWKDREGVLWFPTMEGLISIDPGREEKNLLPALVVIEGLDVDGKGFPPDQHLILPTGASRLEIQYSGICLQAAEKVLFRFRLEGFDKDWVNAGKRRTAVYTNLPPGQYVFQVIACNNDGLWNEKSAGLSFQIQPLFYQTGWFRWLLFLVFAGLIGTAHRIRIRHLHTREEDLKKHIDQAMAHIKMLNGLLPICSSCKKVRDDQGYWSQIETYISKHSEATFSHSICPDCADKLYPQYTEVIKERKQNSPQPKPENGQP